MENEIRRFIKDVVSSDVFDGCAYIYLDDKYALVFAWNIGDEGGVDDDGCVVDDCLYGKIAYNCDDLQCDYDYDWEMGNADTEITYCNFEDGDWLFESFMHYYEMLMEEDDTENIGVDK